MAVTVNGKPTSLAEPRKLSEFVESLGIDLRLVAVAHNGEVLPRQSLSSVIVRDGDKLEIVRMVGGGA